MLVGLLCAAANGQPQQNARAALEQQRAFVQSQLVLVNAAVRGAIRVQASSLPRKAPDAAKLPEDAFFLASRRQAPAFCAPLPKRQLAELTEAAAANHSLRPELIRAVVRQESAGQPCAISSAGAMGLMQLMPATASQFGVTDPFDPRQNLDAGARFLKDLMMRYGGDLSLALSAYNAGPAVVDSVGIPKYRETQNYLKRIFSLLPE